MPTFLLLDTELFFFINQSLANPFFDLIMPFITDLDNWRIPILITWIFLMLKGGKKGRVVGTLLILVLISSDLLSSAVVKPAVGRIRPCHLYENLRLLVNCGGKYCFPSSHASNISAFAVLFSYFYRKGTLLFLFIALLVGFSRIYVGVHFPIDVLAGYILGSGCAYLLARSYQILAQKYQILQFYNKSALK